MHRAKPNSSSLPQNQMVPAIEKIPNFSTPAKEKIPNVFDSDEKPMYLFPKPAFSLSILTIIRRLCVLRRKHFCIRQWVRSHLFCT